MNIKGKYNWIKHLDFIALNLLAMIVSFVLAYFLRFGNMYFLLSPSWRSMLAVLLLISVAMNLSLSPYSGVLRRPSYAEVLNLAKLTAYSFIIVAILLYLFKVGAVYSRLMLVGTFLLYFALSVVFTYIRKKLILNGKAKGMVNREHQLFLITTRKDIEETVHNLFASDIKEFEIAGYCFTDWGHETTEYDGKPVIKTDEVASFVVTEHIDDVFIAAAPQVIKPEDYKSMVDNGVIIHMDLESLIGIETGNQFITNLGVYKAASVGDYTFGPRRMVYLLVKRILDFIFGAIGTLLLIPIVLVVKMSYLMSGDRASIFYTQPRVGQYGKDFKLLKLRSMVPNADEILKELLKQEEYKKQWEENQKFDDDPRITPVGKFLRKTSLDEFPQFINVLKGDMSIVGPRPLIKGELEEHNGLTLYNKVRPGITGWWGCNGRSNIDYRERLELEYYYVKNCSLSLDIICVIRTALAVIRTEGAQ